MGINSASKLVYKTITLTLEQVAEVFFALASENAREEHDQNDASVLQEGSEDLSSNVPKNIPCIDVDCNNVAFHNKYHDSVVANICVMEALRKMGAKVTMIADGESRHFSKRASADRIIQREKSRLRAIELNTRLMHLRQNNGTDEELHKISAQIVTAQKKAESTLPIDFLARLEETIETFGDDNTFFLKAKYQADPLIAKRSVQNLSDLIWSSDSDFIIHNPS